MSEDRAMHVAIVSETYPPEINGVAQTIQLLERGMRELGHHVSLVRPRQRGETGGPSEPTLVTTASAPVPRYPGLRMGLPCAARLRRHWRAHRPDAIYIATEGPLGHSALRSARALDIPRVTGFHTRFDQYAAAYGLRGLEPLVSGWLKRFHAQAHATLVPTRELAAELRAKGYRHVEVMGRGVDTHRFNPCHRDPTWRRVLGAEEEAVVLLHVGRVAPEKNLGLAVRSFEAIRARLPQARFVVVGDGPERARLQERHPEIVFTGALPRHELARCYASADLFLFPSLSETFGNVTLEAMASGLPLVAFDYAAARQHVLDGRTGVLVPYGDADAFVRSAVALAGNGALRRSMGVRAREAVLGVDIETVVRRFANVLSRAVDAQAGTAMPAAASARVGRP